jgi:hypothetical protein
MKLPHLRIDCANPKQAERLALGDKSPISASRGAACRTASSDLVYERQESTMSCGNCLQA